MNNIVAIALPFIFFAITSCDNAKKDDLETDVVIIEEVNIPSNITSGSEFDEKELSIESEKLYLDKDEVKDFIKDNYDDLGMLVVDGVINAQGDTITVSDLVPSKTMLAVCNLEMSLWNGTHNDDQESIEKAGEYFQIVQAAIQNGFSLEILQGLSIGHGSNETVSEFPKGYDDACEYF